MDRLDRRIVDDVKFLNALFSGTRRHFACGMSKRENMKEKNSVSFPRESASAPMLSFDLMYSNRKSKL
jgi:hypothetical protein